MAPSFSQKQAELSSPKKSQEIKQEKPKKVKKETASGGGDIRNFVCLDFSSSSEGRADA